MSKNRQFLILMLVLAGSFCHMEQAFCEENSAAQLYSPGIVEQQLSDDLKNYTPNYIGVATAKDAFGTENYWQWYWDRNAHINITRGFFWGDDQISQFFQSLADSYMVPAWNVIMEPLASRILAPLLLFGLTITSFIRKKKAAKAASVTVGKNDG
ncbi:MAG: hypothetical protein SGJ27_04910 [Candidatus Melainabacteria bacterium]|nr:hypothetical protein [Candidatus Melainabacteria bacterium]